MHCCHLKRRIIAITCCYRLFALELIVDKRRLLYTRGSAARLSLVRAAPSHFIKTLVMRSCHSLHSLIKQDVSSNLVNVWIVLMFLLSMEYTRFEVIEDQVMLLERRSYFVAVKRFRVVLARRTSVQKLLSVLVQTAFIRFLACAFT